MVENAEGEGAESSLHKSYLFLPKVSKVASMARKNQIENEKEARVREKIEKYIDEYVRKI